jgi:hypothetical protein
LILAIALIPLLRVLHLPVNFDWKRLIIAYWIILAAQSIFVAALLGAIAVPQSFRRMLDRYRRNPLRVVFLLFFFAILFIVLDGVKALILTTDALAIAELLEAWPAQKVRRAAATVLLPALYLFVGFLLVFAYNDIIVSVRFNFTYDPFFNAVDNVILHGSSVSDLAHWAVRHLPLWFFRCLEFVYFGMFPQIGAGILLITFLDGKARGMQFVGSILLSYYLALGCFYLWPSHGPYYLSPSHLPSALPTFTIQKTLMAKALERWNHIPFASISGDYFIAFPCMHIAQPIVVIWFLRRWKHVIGLLCLYDAMLVAAILLLDWHYVVDLVGGVLVAAISLWLTSGTLVRRKYVVGNSAGGESEIAASIL